VVAREEDRDRAGDAAAAGDMTEGGNMNMYLGKNAELRFKDRSVPAA
jgi:hypothetical protein